MLYELKINIKKANIFGRVFDTHSVEVYRTEEQAKESQSKLTKESLLIDCESFTSEIIKHPQATKFIIVVHQTSKGWTRYKVFPND